MENKKKKKTLKIVLIVILAAAVAVGAVYLSVVMVANNKLSWLDKMNEQGPFSCEAVWESENDDIYVFGKKEDNPYNDNYIAVYAYVKFDSKWVKCSVGTRSGMTRFLFYPEDTFPEFSFDVKLKGDKLIFSDFMFSEFATDPPENSVKFKDEFVVSKSDKTELPSFEMNENK